MVDPYSVAFKKLDFRAKEPFRKHGGDAGYDLYAIEDYCVKPNTPTVIRTGISLAMPEGMYCEIHTRSSHGKLGIRNHLGIVDEGYHGEVCPIMISSLKEDYYVYAGDRVAQLIFKWRVPVIFSESDIDFVSDRGTGGFGSTGK